MTTHLDSNIPQQVFGIFYAISWGTAANAQPRWKAFAWPVKHSSPGRYRAWFSFFLLNLVPFFYFAFVLKLLGSVTWDLDAWNWKAFWKVFVSMLPALAPFGFYRVWTAAMQRFSRTFYGKHPDTWSTDSRPEAWKDIGIHLEPADLKPKWALPNLLTGAIYILLGLIAVPLGSLLM